MIERIARRLASSLLVLWLVATGTFLLAYAIPADPARAAVGPHADAATVARVRHQMCLDRPFVVQYGCFVGRIAKGDLGTSFRTRRPVVELLADRVGPSRRRQCWPWRSWGSARRRSSSGHCSFISSRTGWGCSR
jgi:ABC-type dipeptide/oligopeptide/nickel transport system permease component